MRSLFLFTVLTLFPSFRFVQTGLKGWGMTRALSKHRLDYGAYPENEIFDLFFRGVAVPLVRT